MVRTSDPEEFKECLVREYGAAGLVVPNARGLQTRGNFLQMGDIALGFSACGASAIVSFDECDFARMQIALAGRASTTSAGVATEIDAQQACVTSPGRAAVLEYGDGFEHIVLRLQATALKRKLAALLGASPNAMITFDPVIKASQQHMGGLRQLLSFLARQIDTESAALPASVLQELEQAVIVAFLHATQHTFSSFLERNSQDTTPSHVRRVEEYIHANWQEAVTIERLVEVTGVSARAIFRAFQQNRGYSPMIFAKKIRLQHAQEFLKAPDTRTSVTGIAFACGFANLGHFAKDYRTMFGELPSETLTRAKRTNTR